MIIRRARLGDAKNIAECFYASCEGLCKKCYNKYLCNDTLYSEKKIATLDKRLGTKNHLMLVATDSSKIVGFASLVGNSTEKTRHRAECGWFVSIGHSRQGIATRLVDKLIKEAKKSGLRKLEAEAAVENIASVNLAKKLGFEIEGKKKAGMLLDDGKFVDTYILGKVL